MTQQRVPVEAPKIGLFAIGLEAYWSQFEGIRDRLEGYHRRVEDEIQRLGGDVVSAGLVDTAERAREAGDAFSAAGVDLVICQAVTYGTSSLAIPALQGAGVPALLIGLQPTGSADYEETDTAEWLANDATCCIPELAGACVRCRIPYDTVVGVIDDDRAWGRIAAWIRAAGAARAVSRARLGFLGHTYPGMLDMYSDFTAFHADLGAHVEVLEIDDLGERVAAVNDQQVAAKLAEMREAFDWADPSSDPVAAPINDQALDWSARVAVGLDRLVDDYDLTGLTYYYRGIGGNEAERLGAGMIVGNSLLTARGIPTSGEGDLKTNVAQLLLDRLGAGGSYTEFYALDFEEEFVLMGHDGPAHVAIAEGRPTLRNLKLYHGKSGQGLSVECRVQYGPVTIVGCTQTESGRLKLIVAEGESIPGPTLRIGNTNSRLRFSLGPAEFFEAWCAEGPTHHVALGVGSRAREIAIAAKLLDLPIAEVGG